MANDVQGVTAIKLRIRNKCYHFIVDTGATQSTIIRELIPEGSKIVKRGLCSGAGGVFSASLYRINGLNIEGVKISEFLADDSITAMSIAHGVTFGGLLGIDFLSCFKSVTFDYGKRIIEFKL